jgi:hypothetical protein
MVRPGHVVKWLLRMALVSVETEGENRQACRNCMRSGIVLLVALARCTDCFGGVMLMRHKPLWSRGPVKTGLLSCMMVTSLLYCGLAN